MLVYCGTRETRNFVISFLKIGFSFHMSRHTSSDERSSYGIFANVYVEKISVVWALSQDIIEKGRISELTKRGDLIRILLILAL